MWPLEELAGSLMVRGNGLREIVTYSMQQRTSEESKIAIPMMVT